MCVHLWSGVSPEFAEGDHHADAADAAADDDDDDEEEEEDDNEGEGDEWTWSDYMVILFKTVINVRGVGGGGDDDIDRYDPSRKSW